MIAASLKTSTTLTKILVGNNELGDKGATILCDALRESTVTKVQELGLDSNKIGPQGAKAIAAFRAVSPSVTSIDISRNDIGADGAKAIAEGLKDNASVTEVNLDGFALPIKQLKGIETVASLDFSGQALGIASAVVIASLIRDNASLTRLDVSSNVLDRGGNGVQLLRDAVRQREGFLLVDDDND